MLQCTCIGRGRGVGGGKGTRLGGLRDTFRWEEGEGFFAVVVGGGDLVEG